MYKKSETTDSDYFSDNKHTSNDNRNTKCIHQHTTCALQNETIISLISTLTNTVTELKTEIFNLKQSVQIKPNPEVFTEKLDSQTEISKNGENSKTQQITHQPQSDIESVNEMSTNCDKDHISLHVKPIQTLPIQTHTKYLLLEKDNELSNKVTQNSKEVVDHNLPIHMLSLSDILQNMTEIKAQDLRAGRGLGYGFIKSYISKLNKYTQDPIMKKRVILIKATNDVTTLMGGSEILENMTYTKIVNLLISKSTCPDTIESLYRLHKFTWSGHQDPMIFSAKLRHLYDTLPIDNTKYDFNQHLGKNITQNMLEKQKDIWEGLFESDATQTLYKLATYFQDKGKAYFFGNISIHKSQQPPEYLKYRTSPLSRTYNDNWQYYDTHSYNLSYNNPIHC